MYRPSKSNIARVKTKLIMCNRIMHVRFYSSQRHKSYALFVQSTLMPYGCAQNTKHIYKALAFSIAVLTSGKSTILVLPSTFTKLSLYGCAAPSKTAHKISKTQNHNLLNPSPKDSPFSRSNLLSLSLFFGNIPLTAFRSTSPPPHLRIMPSMLISFKLPGRVECV